MVNVNVQLKIQETSMVVMCVLDPIFYGMYYGSRIECTLFVSNVKNSPYIKYYRALPYKGGRTIKTLHWFPVFLFDTHHMFRTHVTS
jgi:hypothetical protein